MLSRPRNPFVRALLDGMRETYDGRWVSHSINMLNARIAQDVFPPGDRPLILPYGSLLSFSWKRGDLCCDYYFHEGTEVSSLFEGRGFNWTMAFSLHLFHSQSGSFLSRSFESLLEQQMRPGVKGEVAEKTNFAEAVSLAIDHLPEFIVQLSALSKEAEAKKSEITREINANEVKYSLPRKRPVTTESGATGQQKSNGSLENEL